MGSDDSWTPRMLAACILGACSLGACAEEKRAGADDDDGDGVTSSTTAASGSSTAASGGGGGGGGSSAASGGGGAGKSLAECLDDGMGSTFHQCVETACPTEWQACYGPGGICEAYAECALAECNHPTGDSCTIDVSCQYDCYNGFMAILTGCGILQGCLQN